MSYSLLKSLHLLGVVLFLGNIIVTALWKSLADRSRDAVVIAFSQRLVGVTDLVFTAAGAILIVTTGLHMAGGHAAVFRITWLAWGFGLFIASGLVWVALLIPVQIRQWRLLRKLGPGDEVPAEYWRLARLWSIFGSVATLLPLVNLYFMVFQPV